MSEFKYEYDMWFGSVRCKILTNNKRDMLRLRTMARGDWSFFKWSGRTRRWDPDPTDYGGKVDVCERPFGQEYYVYRTRKVLYNLCGYSITEYGTERSLGQNLWECKDGTEWS